MFEVIVCLHNIIIVAELVLRRRCRVHNSKHLRKFQITQPPINQSELLNSLPESVPWRSPIQVLTGLSAA